MPVTRKLVAVVMADVVGYSRLMERDESGTRDRTRSLHDGLIAPKAAEHGGRIVKTAGDGFLLEFASATAALRFAVELQRELGVRNLYVARDERLELRVGINLGDIIVEDQDIFGDGVNIAARLQTLAQPGGICVSSAIVDQVHEHLGVGFIDAGEQHVKNISKPVRVFRIALARGSGPAASTSDPASPGSAAARASRLAGRRGVVVAIAVVAIAGIATAAWWYGVRAPATSGSVAKGAPPRSIMVMPFGAPPDDAELRALADALTTAMTRAFATGVRNVAVVAPDVAATAASGTDERIAIARRSNALYVIEGTVTVQGGDVVTTTRVLDARFAKDLGGDRQVVARADLASEHDRLAKRITLATRELFESAEMRRVLSTPLPPDAKAQDYADRASAFLNRPENLPALREARKLLDEAIRRDPSLADAWASRAFTAFSEWSVDYAGDNARLLAEMERDSLQAVTLDDRYPLAWSTRAYSLMAQNRFDAALAANERAQQLDPTRSFEVQAAILNLMGRGEEALKLVAARNAMLDRDSDVSLAMISCEANLYLGDYAKAIANCERAVTRDDTYFVHFNLAAAYAQVGDIANATKAREELIRRVPTLTIARYWAKQWSNVPAWVEQQRLHVVPGLRKAGVPD